MQTYQQRLNYEKLELIPPQGIRGLAIAFPSTFRELWDIILGRVLKLAGRLDVSRAPRGKHQVLKQTLALFDQTPAPEPHVQKRIASAGKIVWKVYALADDCFILFDTEEEVLVWLEARHR